MGSARLAGHYINMLGTGSVLWMIAGPILGYPLRIDLGFILFFWIGMGLLDGRSGRRKVVLILNSLVALLTAGYLVSLLWATGPVSGGQGTLRTPLLASIHAGILLLLFIPPLILLLLPGTRRWFAEQKLGPPTRYSLNRQVIFSYVLAACVPLAGGIALEGATRTAEPSGVSGPFEYGEQRRGIASAQWIEDKTTGRPLCISWLAFAESTSYGSPHDGHVTFGPHRIAVPEAKPVRYLCSPPVFGEQDGNVLLVREDGKVTRLGRRVPPELLKSALEAGHGVRDFEQLQERLESLLPNAPMVPEKK